MSKEPRAEESKDHTLEKVQRQFEITRDRIRKIEESVQPIRPPEDDDSGHGAPAAPPPPR